MRRDLGAVCQPLLRGGKTTVRVSTGPFPFCSGKGYRAVAGRCGGRSPTEPASRAGTMPSHVQDLYKTACDGCASNGERQAMAKLLREYNDVFSSGDHDVGLTRAVRHEIRLAAGTVSIRQPTKRLGLEKEKKVSLQVRDLLDRGLIEPAHSALSSPVVLVRKKNGSWRFCVDYLKLNSVTIQDAYPLPRIDESLDALAGSKYFSTLDLLSGYWQVPLSLDARRRWRSSHRTDCGSGRCHPSG